MRYIVSILILLAVLINAPLVMRILTPLDNATEYDAVVKKFFDYGATLAYDRQFEMFTEKQRGNLQSVANYTKGRMRAMKQLRLDSGGGRFIVHEVQVNRELDDEVELTVNATRGKYKESYLFLLKWEEDTWKIDNMRMLKVVDFSKFVTGTPVEEFDDDERMPEESVDGMQNEDAGGMPKEGVTGMPREGVSGMPKEGANGVPLKADARRMSEAEKAASGRLEDEGMRKKLISAEKIKDIKSNPQATVKDIKETLGLMLTESEASK